MATTAEEHYAQMAGLAVAQPIKELLYDAFEYRRVRLLLEVELKKVYQVYILSNSTCDSMVYDASEGGYGNHLTDILPSYDVALAWVFANRKPVQSEG